MNERKKKRKKRERERKGTIQKVREKGEEGGRERRRKEEGEEGREKRRKVLTMRTPNDHQSAVVSCPFLFTTSGAMYSTVPQNENVFLSSTASLDRPKSTKRRKWAWQSCDSHVTYRLA